MSSRLSGLSFTVSCSTEPENRRDCMIWQFGVAGKSQLLICFAADPAGSLFAGVDVAKGQY